MDQRRLGILELVGHVASQAEVGILFESKVGLIYSSFRQRPQICCKFFLKKKKNQKTRYYLINSARNQTRNVILGSKDLGERIREGWRSLDGDEMDLADAVANCLEVMRRDKCSVNLINPNDR